MQAGLRESVQSRNMFLPTERFLPTISRNFHQLLRRKNNLRDTQFHLTCVLRVPERKEIESRKYCQNQTKFHTVSMRANST